MKRYQVEFSPSAARQAERAREWWVANRPSAPALFAHELAAAIRQLARAPHSAPPYEAADAPMTRRLLMPRSRHHVYFIIDEGDLRVRVYAVWHASRGSGPHR